MSVRGHTKSNPLRTLHVESGGPARMFPHLTRGDLPRENVGGVSRGRSSEEVRESGQSEGPKNQETNKGIEPCESKRKTT